MQSLLPRMHIDQSFRSLWYSVAADVRVLSKVYVVFIAKTPSRTSLAYAHAGEYIGDQVPTADYGQCIRLSALR